MGLVGNPIRWSASIVSTWPRLWLFSLAFIAIIAFIVYQSATYGWRAALGPAIFLAADRDARWAARGHGIGIVAGRSTPPLGVIVDSRAFGIIVALWMLSCSALADAPLPPPATFSQSSPSGKFTAVSDPSSGTTIVESASGKQLWQVTEWHRSLFLSDDGEHLAIGYDGLNLLPLDAPDSLEMISFWSRAGKIQSVPLRAIVPDRSILQRTVSHYAWGNIVGIDHDDRLVVTRIDGKVFRFNMSTGAAEWRLTKRWSGR